MVATFRSVILKKLDFGSGGHSVYDWSLPFIVVIQNLIVMVGILAILFRFLALFRIQELGYYLKSLWIRDEAIGQRNQILGKWHTWQTSIGTLFKNSISAAQLLVVIPFYLVGKYFGLFKYEGVELFEDLPHQGLIVAGEYIAAKNVDEIIKFREVCCRVSLKNLLQLLPRTSAQQLYPRVDTYKDFLDDLEKQTPELCSLSVALLMKIAQICIPEDHLGSLFPCAYLEAKHIILFIDQTLLTRDFIDASQLSFARAMWKHGDFSCLIPDNILAIQPDLNHAVAIMETLKEKFHGDDICCEIDYMVDFINPQNYSSIEELSEFIKEMLVYMLRLLITQLPVAIHKNLSECPREEFEEKVKLALSFLFKMESAGALENEIDWSFPPPATGISSFIVDETPVPNSTGPLRRLGEIYPYNS